MVSHRGCLVGAPGNQEASKEAFESFYNDRDYQQRT